MDLWTRIERLVASITADALDDDADTREAWTELEAYLDGFGPPARGAGRPGEGHRAAPSGGPGKRPGPPPPAVRQALYDLEIVECRDEQQLRQAYRRLLKRYHPDRFASDGPRHAHATEVTRRLTLAYRTIRDYYFQ